MLRWLFYIILKALVYVDSPWQVELFHLVFLPLPLNVLPVL
jgi:hypothetical protein